eukprot:1211293-Pleurochrysis_carterae.AAC.2
MPARRMGHAAVIVLKQRIEGLPTTSVFGAIGYTRTASPLVLPLNRAIAAASHTLSHDIIVSRKARHFPAEIAALSCVSTHAARARSFCVP